jgi:hypothetical protein
MPEIIGRSSNRQAHCDNCGADMIFRKTEVKAGARIVGSEDSDHKSVVICPSCKRPVDVTGKVGTTTAQQAAREDRDDI